MASKIAIAQRREAAMDRVRHSLAVMGADPEVLNPRNRDPMIRECMILEGLAGLLENVQPGSQVEEILQLDGLTKSSAQAIKDHYGLE